MDNDAYLIATTGEAFLVLTTLPSPEEARRIARAVVEERLAACASLVDPIASIYWWEGKVVEEGETLVIFKTTSDRLEALKTAILEQHPYEVPEMVVISPDRIAEPYLAWLRDSTK